MAQNFIPTVDRIRILPRSADFLDRTVGSKGEVFYSNDSKSLRIFNGADIGGVEIARADLNNVTITNDDISWIAYDDLGSLPSATDNHGMFAHVHGTGKAYYAHAGNWVELADQADITSVADISELTDTTNLIPAALTDLGIADGDATQILTTDGEGNFTFEDAPATGSTQNLFATITSDDGSATANTVTDTLNVLGGTNIATAIATDTDNLTINMSAFSIDFLSDVDTTSSAPATGNVLKWNGTNWAPGADATTGGAGTDADTLDGFDSAYFLNYSNFSNTPSILTLASLSIGNELTASGDGAISYDDTTGVFRYTPPDLSTYLTSVTFDDLTTTPTTLAGYGITDALPSSTSIPAVLTDLSITDGTSGQVLTTDGSGGFTFTTVSGGGGGGGIALTDLSVGTPGLPSNTGQIEYNNTTGVFTYTPPTVPAALTDLGIIDGNTGDVLTTNGGGGFTFSSFAAQFSSISEVTTASTGTTFNFSQIYMPAARMFRLDNISASAYTFDGYAGNNPTIYVISGHTYAFDLEEINGHPFEIQDSTGAAYSTGLVHVASDGTVSTGTNAQGKSSGTLYWTIDESEGSPPNFRYQCTSHSGMVGAIVIKSISLI